MKKQEYELGEAEVVELSPAAKLLVRARELISNKRRWCQRDIARTKNYRTTRSKADNAYSFCAVGSVEHLSSSQADENAAIRYLGDAADELFDNEIEAVNDVNTRPTAHAKVMKTFDLAITLAIKGR